MQTKEVSDEEDEVKVHVTDDIEEGEARELSSGEEGEIKGTHTRVSKLRGVQSSYMCRSEMIMKASFVPAS